MDEAQPLVASDFHLPLNKIKTSQFNLNQSQNSIMRQKLFTWATLVCLMFVHLALKSQNMNQTVYQFTVQDIHGKDVSLDQFKGKVLLIVNVASECGYTPQYADLQALYESHKDKGLVVLGFPANEFGAQEPGTNAEILTFCSTKFGVDFPMFSKIVVKGEDQHPLYKFLTHSDLNGSVDADMKWNFQKFLISREGKVLRSIKPGMSVNDEEAHAAIEAALN